MIAFVCAFDVVCNEVLICLVILADHLNLLLFADNFESVSEPLFRCKLSCDLYNTWLVSGMLNGLKMVKVGWNLSKHVLFEVKCDLLFCLVVNWRFEGMFFRFYVFSFEQTIRCLFHEWFNLKEEALRRMIGVFYNAGSFLLVQSWW